MQLKDLTYQGIDRLSNGILTIMRSEKKIKKKFIYVNWNSIDVANWKRHQRLDEILIFFYPHYIIESAKLFSKNSVMQYARET